MISCLVKWINNYWAAFNLFFFKENRNFWNNLFFKHQSILPLLVIILNIQLHTSIKFLFNCSPVNVQLTSPILPFGLKSIGIVNGYPSTLGVNVKWCKMLKIKSWGDNISLHWLYAKKYPCCWNFFFLGHLNIYWLKSCA